MEIRSQKFPNGRERMDAPVCSPQDCAIGCTKLVDDFAEFGPRFLADPNAGRYIDELSGGLEKIQSLSRRRFLSHGAKSAGGLLLSSVFVSTFINYIGTMTARAETAVETGKFVFPRLQFTTVDGTGKHWDISPIGDAILRQQLKGLTNVNISMEPKIVRLSDFDDMCRNPFVFMTAGGAFKLPDNEEQNLHEFLNRGGFILADDCMGVGGGNDVDAFFTCYSKLINRLYPDNPLRPIPNDHEIFHCYFDFPAGCPELQGIPHGAHGLFEPGTGRIMTWLSSGDIHCGWVCKFWSMERNMDSIKMGINIIVYFLSH
jgi:hypothetical protein